MIGRCRTKNSFALLLASALLAGIVQAEIRPNVVVFLVDDMGLMDTSVPFVVDKEGNPVPQPLNARYRTPNMEKLAERGVRFAHFYANSVCSPSRVSLLKGQYSARHKTTDFIHPQKKNVGPKDWNWDGITTVDNTLQGLMKAAGYKTVIIGKGHLGSKVSPGEDPLKIGFTDKVAASHFGAPGSYYDDKCFGIKTLRAVPDLEKYHGKDIFLTEALSLEATREIDEAVKERKPFFLYMSHYAVHTPFEADPRFVDNYKGSKNKNWRAFATLIEGMDKSLGDLVNHLERIGEAENTLIIFLGDNGSYAPLGRENDVGSSAPYRGKKGSRYEG
jgi:arylsulfatase A-like enzyme